MRLLPARSWFFFWLVVLLLSSKGVSAESRTKASGAEKSTGKQSWGYSFDLGLALKQTSLDVFKKEATDPEGTLTSNFIVTYSLSLATPSKFLFDSNLGVTLLMNYSAIKMDTQEVDSEDIDLGTSARGFFAYVTPVLFYHFGDKVPQEGKKFHAFKVGFGVGLGYLKATGDIILTENVQQERLSFKLEDYSVALGLYIDYRYNRFFSRLTLAGPELSDGPFEYNLFDISWDIGTRFDF